MTITNAREECADAAIARSVNLHHNVKPVITIIPSTIDGECSQAAWDIIIAAEKHTDSVQSRLRCDNRAMGDRMDTEPDEGRIKDGSKRK